MWDCEQCGTHAIGTVAVCPNCGAERAVAPAQDVTSGSPAQGGQEPEDSRPEGSPPVGDPDVAQEQESKDA